MDYYTDIFARTFAKQDPTQCIFTYMRSILHQLKKYQPPTNDNVIEIDEDKPDPNAITTNQLAETIARGKASESEWEKAKSSIFLSHNIEQDIKAIEQLINDMPHGKWADILYPLEVLAIYHCYYNRSKMVANEQTTDYFFQSFLAGMDMEKFRDNFKEAIDDNVMRHMMCRIIIATYGGNKKEDRLPTIPFRAAAAKSLGIGNSRTLQKEVLDIQDSLIRSSSLEQIILGRMGYLFTWHWWNKIRITKISRTPYHC